MNYKDKNWGTSYFERDNYTYVFCNKRGGNLQVDHIKTYTSIIEENNLQTVDEAKNCDDLWDINNGRTLCIETETWGEGTKKLLAQSS